MKSNKEEAKKPFLKKWGVIAITIIIAIILIGKIIGSNKKIKWSSLELGEYLPAPVNVTGKIDSNSDNYFSVTIDDPKKENFKKYVDLCIEKGYTIDSEKTGTSYKAFNAEGYELSMYSMSKEFSIHLNAPDKMSLITWPDNGIGSLIPATSSNLGKVMEDTSKSYRVHVGNTSIAQYNSYVKACEDKGFNLDYHKTDKTYEAKNVEGYRLNLRYLGGNNIDVLIQTPKEEISSSTQTSQENTNSSNNTKPKEENSSNTSGLSKDFKDAMDSYEEFMDEYVDFMKKYESSNGSDISLMSDYAKYMSKYAEVCKKFDKWKNEDMNTAETAYYIDVQARVNKKLLEVAN